MTWKVVWPDACINLDEPIRMVIIVFELMFWTAIHLQPGNHVFEGNNVQWFYTILVLAHSYFLSDVIQKMWLQIKNKNIV